VRLRFYPPPPPQRDPPDRPSGHPDPRDGDVRLHRGLEPLFRVEGSLFFLAPAFTFPLDEGYAERLLFDVLPRPVLDFPALHFVDRALGIQLSF